MEHYEKQQTDRGVGLTCPRCDGKLILNYVKVLDMKAAAHVSTITCPYCSKVSRIPAEDLTAEHKANWRSDDQC